MKKIMSYFKKDGSIQYKNIIILLLSFLLLVTYRGYWEKSKFEDTYNQEFYIKFNMHYLAQDSSLVQYLQLTEKAINQEEMSDKEIADLEEYRNLIYPQEHALIDFYSKHYQDDVDGNEQYNRGVLVDFLLYQLPLGQVDFEKIPQRQHVYRLKDSVLEEKQVLYLSEKINSLLELLESYKADHIEDYKTYENEKYFGKDFVKSGIWMEFLEAMATSIVSIEKSFNFGENAPTEVIAEEYTFIPNEIYNNTYQLQQRGYKIIPGEYRLYLFAYTYGHREDFEVISIDRLGDEITISINTQGTLVSGSNSNGTSLIVLLRGLDPNEVDKLHFNVTDERGVPLPKITQ